MIQILLANKLIDYFNDKCMSWYQYKAHMIIMYYFFFLILFNNIVLYYSRYSRKYELLALTQYEKISVGLEKKFIHKIITKFIDAHRIKS